MLEQMDIWEWMSCQDIPYGKTSQGPCPVITEKTSEPSWKKPQGSQKREFLFLDLRKDRSGATQVQSVVMDGLLHGESTMHSIGAFRRGEKESAFLRTSTDTRQQTFFLNVSEKPLQTIPTKLSEILEDNPDPRYMLSEKACQGILRRANARGKKLPEVLEKALIQQATPSKSGGGVEIDSYGKRAGKGALVQTELSGTLGVSQDQTLFDSTNVIAASHGGFMVNADDSGKGNGYRPSHRGDGYKESDIQYTLNSTEQHGVAYGIDAYNQSSTGEQAKSLTSIASDSDHFPCVCYGLDRASFNQGKNAKYDFSVQEEISQPLVARGPGGGIHETIGSLCARDYKGVGSQYVDEGKVIVQ